MERNQFSAFSGVFTPCILTILGVIMFMRAGFVVGHGGVWEAALILALAASITLFTALSTSAIGTNMHVGGGGAYFLISRVLGPEYGGAVGIVLFFALAASVPFYVLGFSEALAQTLPATAPHRVPISFVTTALLFIVAYVGAGWAIRFQFLIMAVLFAAIFLFLGGAFLQFSPDTLWENLAAHPVSAASGDTSFWALFAIYFPAVTGIMAGVNMSGDLRDPAKSIPRGMLMAIVVSVIVYGLQLVLMGGAFSRDDLMNRPFLSLRDHALFGAGPVVTAGMFAATLSSALGSFLGAPRVLQALARDGILPIATPFARGSARGDEPRRALWLTAGLAAGILWWAAASPDGNPFNVVAEVITMFFLCTYGLLNVAAFIEGVGGNPSFRPQFRFFHWSTALLGAVGCIGVAWVIHPLRAAISVVLLGGLIWYIKRREMGGAMGSAWRGFLYRNIRNDLIRLSEIPETAKNWRPTCLVFSGNAEIRARLVDYGAWLEGDRGLVFLAEVLVGSFEDYDKYRAAALERLHEFCREKDMKAFPLVVVDESLEHGMAGIIQSLQVGPIRPNLALWGWRGISEQGESAAEAMLRLCHSLNVAVTVVHPGARLGAAPSARIDLWWRGMKNGGLMLLLAHLLRGNWAWRQADIRLLRVIPHEAGRQSTLEDLTELIRQTRIDVTPEVLVTERPFAEVLHAHSNDAACVFLGLDGMPDGEEKSWLHRYEPLLLEGPDTLLVAASGSEDCLA
jgi:amino acid transporter